MARPVLKVLARLLATKPPMKRLITVATRKSSALAPAIFTTSLAVGSALAEIVALTPIAKRCNIADKARANSAPKMIELQEMCRQSRGLVSMGGAAGRVAN